MSTAPAHDRLGHLISGQAPPSFNGIDFVEIVGGDRSRLRVHFLNTAPVQGTLSASPPVTICGGQAGAIAVAPVDESQVWSADEDGRPVLSLAVVAPTDSSIYTLTLFSTVLDPYFDSVQFSFDASSTSQLDCQAPASELPPPPGGRRRSTTWSRTSAASSRHCWTSRRCATHNGSSGRRPTWG